MACRSITDLAEIRVTRKAELSGVLAFLSGPQIRNPVMTEIHGSISVRNRGKIFKLLPLTSYVAVGNASRVKCVSHLVF